MRNSIATVTLENLSPLSMSRQHDDPKLEGESHGDYDARTWRSKMHVSNGSVVIPLAAMFSSIVEGCKYSGKQIPGKGKSTWTQKFASGIMLTDDIRINIDPATVNCVIINANADGVRGSGKRVTRRFPSIPRWEATFDVHILDPIITKDVFAEMVEIAGLFIGIGQGRPGMKSPAGNGRFKLVKLAWQDNRKLAA